MKAIIEQLRFGNWIIFDDEPYQYSFGTVRDMDMESEHIGDYIPLTEEWLDRFGFIGTPKKSYVNGTQWTLQVTGQRDGNDINRDETWFDGIGNHSWLKDDAVKTMSVSSLCRGNYICSNISHVHQLQNLYFALTGEELTLKG